MAESIENFVAKLQTEGVQAGQQAAEKLRHEAEKQAEDIVSQAKQQAEEIVATAGTQADAVAARTQTELELAARDVVLRLRQTLSRALEAVLARGAKEKLADVDFLGKVLHELILIYAKSDLEGTDSIKINVSEEIREKLVKWALHEIGQDKTDKLGISLNLKGRLATAGFEYTVAGATIEVTVSSAVEALSQLVAPSLGEILDKAVAANEK